MHIHECVEKKNHIIWNKPRKHKPTVKKKANNNNQKEYFFLVQSPLYRVMLMLLTDPTGYISSYQD